MHCDKIKIKLSAYLDNELGSEISRGVEEHLAKCSGCREELKALKTINQRIMDFPTLRVSEDFAEQVMLNVDKFALDKKHEKIIRRSIVLITGFFENLFDLIKSRRWSSTRSLEEFGDFPPCSLGRVYINLIE